MVRPVKTMVVAAGERRASASFPGKVEASRRVELAFQVPGLLVKLPVKEGQRVAKGEVIAQLGQDEFQARLHFAAGPARSGRAALVGACVPANGPRNGCGANRKCGRPRPGWPTRKTELDRATRLVQNRTIPRAEFELIETALPRGRRRHAGRDANGRERHDRPRGRHLRQRGAKSAGSKAASSKPTSTCRTRRSRAPYDGVIAERFVEEGQNVRAKQPIVRFQDVDEIEIVVDVPEVGDGGRHPAGRHRANARRAQRRPGHAVPGRRSARSPRWPTRRRRRSRFAPPMQGAGGRSGAARHDRHGDGDLPPGEHPGQADPGARSRR